MSTEIIQSAIAEVRDQMSLDFADGEYLRRVTANLGLAKPKFGFSDDTWRAIVRAIALQFKQIRNKFEDVLSIIFGPRVTEATVLTTSVSLGDKKLFIEEHKDFPQVGVVVLDETLASEESIPYCFIDRTTNTLFLDDQTTAAHDLHERDYEQPLNYPHSAGQTVISVPDSSSFTSTLPATLLVGRGTSSEEVTAVTSVDTTNNTLTISPALVNDHVGLFPSEISSELARDYVSDSEVLVLDSTTAFPDSGYILIGDSDTTIAATGGTTTTFVAAGGTFTAGAQAGNIAVFDGNVTAALAGLEIDIESNTSTTLLFNETLPAPPAVGDNIKIKSKLRYIRNVEQDNMLILFTPIQDVTYTTSTDKVVELLNTDSTVKLAPVQVKSGNWEIYQTNPREIEIFIGAEEEGETVLSASYMHEFVTGSTSTTLAAPASAGDTVLSITDLSNWREFGVIDILGGLERHAYTRRTMVDTFASAGSTSLTINLTTGGLTVGALAGSSIEIGDDLFTAEASTNGASSITFTAPLPDYVFDALVDGVTEIKFFSDTLIDLNEGLDTAKSSGDPVFVYQPVYSGDLLDGDLWNLADVFPGPYVYDPGEEVPLFSVTPVSLNKSYPWGTTIALDASVLTTAIEVVDASLFDLLNFPYTVILGQETSVREEASVEDVNLRHRTATTVATGSSIGATALEVVALSGGGAGDAADFPNANGYRIIIDKDGANEEIVVVRSTTTGPDTIVTDPMTVAHSIGESVELLNDVLTVTQVDNNHEGIVDDSNKLLRWPPITSSERERAATVRVLIDELELASTTGFPGSGNVILNFGREALTVNTALNGGFAAGTSLITLVNSSGLPTSYPYRIVIGKGKPNEEEHLVTNNNTGLNQVTINGGSFGTQFAHVDGEAVEYITGKQEVFSYNSVDGNSLRFSTPIMLEYDHQVDELVFPSTTTSTPPSDGTGFPFRVPPDILERLRLVMDLIRAAGVRVTFLDKR